MNVEVSIKIEATSYVAGQKPADVNLSHTRYLMQSDGEAEKDMRDWNRGVKAQTQATANQAYWLYLNHKLGSSNPGCSTGADEIKIEADCIAPVKYSIDRTQKVGVIETNSDRITFWMAEVA